MRFFKGRSFLISLETNRFRPRVRAIQKTRPIPYRAKVLGRAFLSARTDANSLWMLLSGNAEVTFPSTTVTIATASNFPNPTPTTAADMAMIAPTPTTAADTAMVAPTVATAAASNVVARADAGQKRKAYP
jgi:hypothetical protein